MVIFKASLAEKQSASATELPVAKTPRFAAPVTECTIQHTSFYCRGALQQHYNIIRSLFFTIINSSIVTNCDSIKQKTTLNLRVYKLKSKVYKLNLQIYN